MRHLGAFGRWYEDIFKECCKAHDIGYIQNTSRRAFKLPPLVDRLTLDNQFYECILGVDGKYRLIAIISWLAVRTLYWPHRIIKRITGKSDII